MFDDVFITNDSGSGSTSLELDFCSSGDNCNDVTAISPASSLNFDGTVFSGGKFFYLGSFSWFSGNVVVDRKTTMMTKKTKTKPDLVSDIFLEQQCLANHEYNYWNQCLANHEILSYFEKILFLFRDC